MGQDGIPYSLLIFMLTIILSVMSFIGLIMFLIFSMYTV